MPKSLDSEAAFLPGMGPQANPEHQEAKFRPESAKLEFRPPTWEDITGTSKKKKPVPLPQKPFSGNSPTSEPTVVKRQKNNKWDKGAPVDLD